MIKKITLGLSILGLAFTLAACEREADVASRNLSASAEEFKILRRIVLVNTWHDTYLVEIRGYCSLGNQDTLRARTVTCKDQGAYKKHFLGLSDTVTYFVEQLEPSNVSGSHYKVNFKPSVIVPDITIGR